MSVFGEAITVTILPGVGDEWYAFDVDTNTLYAGENVRKLDLSGLPIVALPDNFDTFQSLVEVKFDHCEFLYLPPVLARCGNLKIISFVGNGMVWVPERSLPTGLVWLNLAHNQLAFVPRSIVLCQDLEICDLRNNRLDYLPCEMMRCRSLRILCLRNNRFRARHYWLRFMESLAHLDYSENPTSRDLSPHPRRYGRTFTRDWEDAEANLINPGYKVLLVMTTNNLPKPSLVGVEGRFSAYQRQSFQDMMSPSDFVHIQGTMCHNLDSDFWKLPVVNVVPNKTRSHFSLVGYFQPGEVMQLQRLSEREPGSMRLRDVLTIMLDVAKASTYFHKNHSVFPTLEVSHLFTYRGETVWLLDEATLVRDYRRHRFWDKIEIKAMGNLMKNLLLLAKYKKIDSLIWDKLYEFQTRLVDPINRRRPSWVEVIEKLELLKDLAYRCDKPSLRQKFGRLARRLKTTVKIYLTFPNDGRDRELGERSSSEAPSSTVIE
ncbi:hypothetical protein GGR57DRAFT_506547 [Xylariaceae sp. FL1272]|nr:hypothetical protein GGR57DRAFT_506547 [Xylariaceae sp. FL1272]